MQVDKSTGRVSFFGYGLIQKWGKVSPQCFSAAKIQHRRALVKSLGQLFFRLTSFEMFPVIVQHINILTVTVKNDSMTRKTEKIKKGGIMRREKVEK